MGLCHRQLRSTHDWSQSKNSLIYLTVPTVLLVVIFNAQIPLRILDILARMTQDTATNFTFYNLIVKNVDGTRASDIDLNISTDWEAVSTDLVIDHWTRIAAPYIFTNLIISLYQWKIFKNDDNLTFIWQEKPSTVVLDIWYNYYGWLTLRITFILHIYIYIYHLVEIFLLCCVLFPVLYYVDTESMKRYCSYICITILVQRNLRLVPTKERKEENFKNLISVGCTH